MKVWIYSGLPGSGKTTLIARRHGTAPVCRTDDHFTKPDGSYVYIPSQIGIAHAECLRKFIDNCRQEWAAGEIAIDDLIVDNTNTTYAEIAPYAAIALAYGHELQIVTVECDPVKAYRRNKHLVPLETIMEMDKALRTRTIAPWWPHEVYGC